MNKKGFFEGKGFYIVLGLCALAIGVSGYVLFFTSPTDENLAVYEPITVAIDENKDTQKDENKDKNIDKKTDTKTEATIENDTDKSIEKPKTEEKEQKMAKLYLKPVQGDILHPFSSEELTFNKAMGDWRTHLGTDFKAISGDRVTSIGDGSVSDIYTDESFGTCVKINHGDGIEIVYSGLSEKTPVKISSKVKAGDVIGTASTNIASEFSENGHIHVAAYKNDTPFDVVELYK